MNNLPSIELLELLKEPFEIGIEITLNARHGNIWANLNTECNSYCHLEDRADGIYAHRREGEIEKVQDFEHLLQLVSECISIKSFFSEKWKVLVKKYHIEIDNRNAR